MRRIPRIPPIGPNFTFPPLWPFARRRSEKQQNGISKYRLVSLQQHALYLHVCNRRFYVHIWASFDWPRRADGTRLALNELVIYVRCPRTGISKLFMMSARVAHGANAIEWRVANDRFGLRRERTNDGDGGATTATQTRHTIHNKSERATPRNFTRIANRVIEEQER